MSKLIPTEYRVQRVPESTGGHLIITSTHPSNPGGWGAAAPTGKTLGELRKDIEKMLAALDKPIIDWPRSR